MKARDTLTTGTLRMALTAITNAEVSGTTAKELTDAEVIAVLAKEVRKRDRGGGGVRRRRPIGAGGQGARRRPRSCTATCPRR